MDAAHSAAGGTYEFPSDFAWFRVLNEQVTLARGLVLEAPSPPKASQPKISRRLCQKCTSCQIRLETSVAASVTLPTSSSIRELLLQLAKSYACIAFPFCPVVSPKVLITWAKGLEPGDKPLRTNLDTAMVFFGLSLGAHFGDFQPPFGSTCDTLPVVLSAVGVQILKRLEVSTQGNPESLGLYESYAVIASVAAGVCHSPADVIEQDMKYMMALEFRDIEEHSSSDETSIFVPQTMAVSTMQMLAIHHSHKEKVVCMSKTPEQRKREAYFMAQQNVTSAGQKAFWFLERLHNIERSMRITDAASRQWLESPGFSELYKMIMSLRFDPAEGVEWSEKRYMTFKYDEITTCLAQTWWIALFKVTFPCVTHHFSDDSQVDWSDFPRPREPTSYGMNCLSAVAHTVKMPGKNEDKEIDAFGTELPQVCSWYGFDVCW